MAQTGEEQLTIDQLAQRTGMTVRNIRAHQSRGLLPAPEVRARTGWYGPDHVARLQLIRELQDEGFNLEAIRHFVSDGVRMQDALRFKRAITAPFAADEPDVLELGELRERLGPELDARRLKRALELGLLVDLGEERYEVPSPTLLQAVERSLSVGVSLDAALAVLRDLNRSVEAIARTFVRLYLDGVWRPFDARGRPEDEWPRVRDALEALRPVAAEAVLAAFGQTMTRAVEEAFGEQLRRNARRGR